MNSSAEAVERIVRFFEQFAPADLARLAQVYREDATFKDPFHEVRGLEAIARVYAHMFDSLQAPRFVVTDRVVQGHRCFLVWEFHFGMRAVRGPQVVRGGSHLLLADDGRIAAHRDYWDAAEELYEKLPLIGVLMRWLKRRAAA